MVRYNWTADDLINKLNYLKLTLQETDNIEEKNEIMNNIEIISNYLASQFNFDNGYTPKMLDMYKRDKKIFQRLNFIWNDIENFCFYTDLVGTPTYTKRCDLSKEDILDLTHEFYKKTFDKYFYGNFMKNFYRKDHIIFSRYDDDTECRGETINIFPSKESFIKINRDFTHEDLIATIHEYMHATSFSINQNHFNSQKNIYTEIETLLVELLACDYFESIFKDDKMNNLKILIHNWCCYQEKQALDKIKLIKKESLLKEYSFNRVLKLGARLCNIDSEYLEELLNESNEKIQVSYLFTIEFYKLFKEDKEKALNILKKFIMINLDNEKDYYFNLKNFGIIPNYSIKDVHRDINTIVRKKVI